jgi:serine/threonine-protein kinase
VNVDTDQQLGGRYLLRQVIGRGAMGQVFAATDTSTGDEVAVKVLRPELVSDPDAVARFMRERQILTSISSSATVRVIDLVAEDQTLAIVMELIRGEDLRRYLRAEGTLPPAEAVSLAIQLLNGLAAVHAAGVVHRDIKPENLLLDIASGGVTLKVTDFGVARLSYGASLTKLSSLIGTPEYMAPELAEAGSAGPSADLYSAGIVLYEMLSGRTPFAGGPPMAVLRRHADMAPPAVPGIPASLWDELSRMLAKDPAGRPASAADAAEALASQAAALARLPALASMPEPTAYQRVAAPAGGDVPDGDGATVVRRRERGAEPPPGAAPGPPGRRAPARRGTRRRRTAITAVAVAVAITVASAITVPRWLHRSSKPSAVAALGATRAVLPTPQPSGSSPSATATGTASAAAPAVKSPAAPASSQPAAAGTVVAPPASTAPAPAPAPAAAAPAPASQSQTQAAPVATQAGASYDSATLSTGSPSVTAQVYFGQLSAIVAALSGQVTFNTPGDWLSTEPGRCAATVVFSGVANATGAVYAEGLGSGWGALEYAPSQNTEQGNLHQQLVTPPATLSPGELWEPSGELIAGDLQLTTSNYSLLYWGSSGAAESWLFQGRAVTCDA